LPSPQSADPPDWATHYTAFVLINLVALGAGVLLFSRMLSLQGVPDTLIVLLAVFLIANDVTKVFLWTPHQQMFSIFTPLFVVYVTYLLAVREYRPLGRYAVWPVAGALGGLLLLVYGNFIVALPLLLLACIARLRKERVSTPITMGVATTTVLMFVLPTIAWIWYVRTVTGSYYSHEVEKYRQVVWIVDAWREGLLALLEAAARRSVRYGRTFLSVEILPFLVAAAGLLAWRVTGGTFEITQQVRDLRKGTFSLPALAAVAFVVFFLLLWIRGFYGTRLTFTLVPLVLYYIGIEAARIFRTIPRLEKPILRALVPLTALWVIFHAAKPWAV
jgi:hypothetical protein